MAKVGLYESNLQQDYGTCLFIVDPQLDFHTDDGKRGYEGSLGVPGANEDSERIAEFIRENIDSIDEIYVSLDTHMKYHIAHPTFWENKEGKNPPPFTVISKKDIQDGTWTPARKVEEKWALEYVSKLEKKGRFKLTIWPEHCKVGTMGHSVHEGILSALDAWEEGRSKSTHYIIKGNNSHTEHYSALQAEVPIGNDPRTKLNKPLMAQLKKQERIILCGQALSHCVNYTTRDIVNNLGKSRAASICILKDASSPVKTFEKEGEDFVKEMTAAGVTLSDTKNIQKFLGKGGAPKEV